MNDSQIIQTGLFSRSLYRIQNINATWAAIMGLVAIPGSVLAAWYWLSPNISITPGIVASDSSPLETEYIIKNIGNISLYDVELGCQISTHEVSNYVVLGNVLNVHGLSESQYIPLLVPGGAASRNCGGYPLAAAPRMTYPATIIVWTTAMWPWPFPLLTYLKSENFKSVKDSGGHTQISPEVP
jgi:hypothetical protein